MPEFIPFFKRGNSAPGLNESNSPSKSPSDYAPLSFNTSKTSNFKRQFSFSNFDAGTLNSFLKI